MHVHTRTRTPHTGKDTHHAVPQEPTHALGFLCYDVKLTKHSAMFGIGESQTHGFSFP